MKQDLSRLLGDYSLPHAALLQAMVGPAHSTVCLEDYNITGSSLTLGIFTEVIRFPLRKSLKARLEFHPLSLTPIPI